MTPSPRLTALKDILARVEMATGPDCEIGAMIYELSGINEAHCLDWCRMDMRKDITRDMFLKAWAPSFTASMDPCIDLAERALPGWAWKCGSCCVSDDAWVAPDFNSPHHGARLREEIGPFESGSVWDAGVDIDRCPPGNVPLAMLEAILTALIAIEEKGSA